MAYDLTHRLTIEVCSITLWVKCWSKINSYASSKKHWERKSKNVFLHRAALNKPITVSYPVFSSHQHIWNLSSHLSACGSLCRVDVAKREKRKAISLFSFVNHIILATWTFKITEEMIHRLHQISALFAALDLCASACVCVCWCTCTSVRVSTVPWDCLQRAHRQSISGVNSWVHAHSPGKWRFNKKNCSICLQWKAIFKLKHVFL